MLMPMLAVEKKCSVNSAWETVWKLQGFSATCWCLNY